MDASIYMQLFLTISGSDIWKNKRHGLIHNITEKHPNLCAFLLLTLATLSTS